MLDVVQIVLVAVLVALAAAQGMLAMAMRRYGKELNPTKSIVSDVRLDPVKEKGRLRTT